MTLISIKIHFSLNSRGGSASGHILVIIRSENTEIDETNPWRGKGEKVSKD